ncbi:hypothetical protein G6F35_014856 [Rhizopus arrhizus]|nr:hypothetical protein G6F35_014856 [Rhizopus arrhizus]
MASTTRPTAAPSAACVAVVPPLSAKAPCHCDRRVRGVSAKGGGALPAARQRPGEEGACGQARDGRAATWRVSAGDGDNRD